MVGTPNAEIAHLWRFPERDCLVCLPDEIFETMQSMAREAMPCETGGTLVGHYSEDRRVAFVTQILVAKTGARRGRSRFYRPPDSVDYQLAKVYRASQGRTYYIGEWHTHPRSAPTPSATDLDTLRGLARSPSVATDTPVMVILGGVFDSESSTSSCILAERSGRCFEGQYEQEKTATMPDVPAAPNHP